jgi:hypothetical protein
MFSCRFRSAAAWFCLAKLRSLSVRPRFRLAARCMSSIQAREDRPPLMLLGAGARPSSCLSLPPQTRGLARRQGAVPGLRRAMSGSGRTMVRSVAPAPCGAPTRHPGLRLSRWSDRANPFLLARCPEYRPGVRRALRPTRGCRSRPPRSRRLMSAPLGGTGCGRYRPGFTKRKVPLGKISVSEKRLTRKTRSAIVRHRDDTAPGAEWRPGACVRSAGCRHGATRTSILAARIRTHG